MKKILLLILTMLLPLLASADNEPYAVLSDDNTVLTLYYDENKESRDGFDVGYKWGGHSEDITTVVFDASFAYCTTLTSTAGWFYQCRNLTEIRNIENLKTGNVTDMSQMFNYCSGLTNLDVSHFDTSNVTNMNAMFCGCSSLTSLDVNGFDTSNVTNMSFMFDGCSGLTSLDLSHFDTSKVTRMTSIFWDCTNLTSLDISSFNTGNVGDMDRMFAGCSNLKSLDVSHFDTQNVTNLSSMFASCSGLTSLDVSTFDTSNVTEIGAMFYGCSGLTSLELNNFDTSNVNSMSNLFWGCSGLTSLDVSSFDTGEVIRMSGLFCGCSGLTNLDVSGFETGNVIYMDEMFSGCTGLTNLDVSHFDTSNVTNMKSMFCGCSGLTSLDVSHFDTSNLGDMRGMFRDCQNLKDIYSNDTWNGNIYEVSSGDMFKGCYNLKGYDDNKTNSVYAKPIADGGYFTPKLKPEPVTINPSDEAEPGEVVVTDKGVTISLGDEDTVDKEKGCITMKTATTPEWVKELLQQKEPDNPDFYEDFTGIYSKYATRGFIKIEFETMGDYELTIMQGSEKVSSYTQKTKGVIKIMYDDAANNWVLIFPTVNAAARAKMGREPVEGGLKIYSITFVPEGIYPGDANNDGTVDAKDIVEVVNYIMGTPSDAFEEDGGDANEDGEVNASDIVTIVNEITKTE